MTAALVVHPDGTVVDVNLKPDADNHLPLMREHIGCSLVDVVRLTEVLDMWIDDEGIYTQPVNPVATALARATTASSGSRTTVRCCCARLTPRETASTWTLTSSGRSLPGCWTCPRLSDRTAFVGPGPRARRTGAGGRSPDSENERRRRWRGSRCSGRTTTPPASTPTRVSATPST